MQCLGEGWLVRSWTTAFSSEPLPSASGEAFAGPPFWDRQPCALRGNLWLSAADERPEHHPEALLRAFQGTGLSPPAFQGGSRLKV